MRDSIHMHQYFTHTVQELLTFERGNEKERGPVSGTDMQDSDGVE